ncbi:MAG: alpha/beta fold hydrolase, partial [Chitinophagaceae bacterium]|nr:alpha/beta fold hydrolase [Chitinophagaceae bacterium]
MRLKLILILCFLQMQSNFLDAQGINNNNNVCQCSEIGLDNKWAEEEKIICYKIPVPGNASNQKETFLMAVAIAKSTRNTNSSLLYLHGGPGISTLSNLPKYLKSDTWKKLREQENLVFFDYRGTGFSEPELENFSDSVRRFSMKNADPIAQHQFRISLIQDYRNKLLAEGINLNDFSSLHNANDAEAIRRALNLTEWNVYGVSHGTTVALQLLKHHEPTVRSMILDSPFPPNAPWVDFIRPFNEAFIVLEKRIENDPDYKTEFKDLRKSFAHAVNRLNISPAKINISPADSNSTYPFTGFDFAWGIWQAMLNPKYITLVPLLIREIEQGNDQLLFPFTSLFNNPDQFGTFSPLQSLSV